MSNPLPNDYFFRIDERHNTLDSLHKTRVFLSQVEEDEFYWKWAMIALHNALYGSMILVLLGTNPGRVRRGSDNKDGKARLIDFWTAFKRVQNPKFMRMFVSSKFVCVTPNADKLSENPKYRQKAGLFPPELNTSLEHLNNYIRNQFLHYYPEAISFGKGGFIQITEDATKLIEFLLLQCGNFRIDSEQEENQIKYEISEIRNIVKKLRAKYNP